MCLFCNFQSQLADLHSAEVVKVLYLSFSALPSHIIWNLFGYFLSANFYVSFIDLNLIMPRQV